MHCCYGGVGRKPAKEEITSAKAWLAGAVQTPRLLQASERVWAVGRWMPRSPKYIRCCPNAGHGHDFASSLRQDGLGRSVTSWASILLLLFHSLSVVCLCFFSLILLLFSASCRFCVHACSSLNLFHGSGLHSFLVVTHFLHTTFQKCVSLLSLAVAL